MNDLSRKPTIELELMAERSLSNGTSPEFMIRHFIEHGVEPERAASIVDKMTARIADERSRQVEEWKSEHRRKSKLGWLLIVCGIVLFLSTYWLKPFAIAIALLGAILVRMGYRLLLHVQMTRKI